MNRKMKHKSLFIPHKLLQAVKALSTVISAKDSPDSQTNYMYIIRRKIL